MVKSCLPTTWTLFPCTPGLIRIGIPFFFQITSSGRSPSATVQMTRSRLPCVKFAGNVNFSTNGATIFYILKSAFLGKVQLLCFFRVWFGAIDKRQKQVWVIGGRLEWQFYSFPMIFSHWFFPYVWWPRKKSNEES